MPRRKQKRLQAKKQTPPTLPQQVVVNDFKIEVRSIDRSRKDLNKWRSALLAAESIVRPNRSLLYDLYAEIILDDHLRTVMDQRRLAITNTTLTFLRDGKEVESINRLIDTEAFEQLLLHLIDSRFYGHSLIHADFQTETVELVPRPNVYTQKRIVTATPYDDTGIDYTAAPFDRYYLPVGQPDDLGLILIATPLVLIKRGDLSDWAQFNEIFGQPTRVGKYDPNMPGHRELMRQALEEAGAMAYLTVPVGSELEFVEANKTGATDTYSNLYECMESAISKLIVGQTMTTEDGSSRSQAEVHERLAGRISQSDRRFTLRYLNGRFRDMLIAQGYSEAVTGDFQFIDEEEQISKKDRLEMDLKIHKEVGRLKKEYFAEEYNVPFVDDSDEPEQPEPEPIKTKKAKVELSVPDDFFD